MTDSNINNLLNNEEEVTNENPLIDNATTVDDTTTVDNTLLANNNVENNFEENLGDKPVNVFSKSNLFKNDLSFIDFDTEYNLNNSINNFYLNDTDTYEFQSDEFNFGRSLFENLTEDAPEGVIPISDGMLQYLRFNNFFDKFKNDNTPIKLPKDRIEINKLFKNETGYSFQEMLNNDIPKDVIETPEFQGSLNNIIKFYEDKGFTVPIVERTNLTQFNQTLKGFGIELTGGLSLDFITAPLLKLGPYGALAYVGINSFGGAYLNYLSQEGRMGQAGFLGQKDKLKWGELFTSTALQTIPYGVTDKGIRGISKSFLFGGTIGGGETTVRTLIDENRFPNLQEYLFSIGLGGTFAASLKGGLELFNGLLVKFKGKSATEVSKLISDNEIEGLNKFFSDTQILQKQLEQQPQGNIKGEDGDEVVNLITSMIDNITKRSTSKDGTLKFKNKQDEKLFNELTEKRKLLLDQKDIIKNTEKINETSKTKDVVRTYVMPQQFKNMKVSYGRAKILFKSDFDRIAWSLRFGKKKYPQNEGLMVRSLIDQGFTEKEVREHGAKLHQKIKNMVIEKTGTSQAGNNTIGLELTIPASKGFITAKTKVKQKTKTTVTTDDFALGMKVKASDRNNIGTVVAVNKDSITVQFVSKQGTALSKKFKRNQLTPLNKKRIKTEEIGETIKSTENGEEVTSKQNLGDRNKNPQQVEFIKNLKPKQQQQIEQIIAILKDVDIFTGSKSQVQTKLEGLGMFDEGVLTLSNTKQIKEYAGIYAKLYDLVPSDSLNYALSQVIVLASDNVANVNQKLISAIKNKNPSDIRIFVDKLAEAFLEVEEWLTLGIPLRTQAARTVTSFKMKPESGITGKTVEEVINMTPNQKKTWEMIQPDIEGSIEEKLRLNQEFKSNFLAQVKIAEETGDYSELIRLTNQISQTEGVVEKIVPLVQANKFDVKKGISNLMRTYNEIGINALLSAPTTQEINLFSGIAMSYLKSANLLIGSSNPAELKAAIKHLFALHQNFNFARKAWKRSWDMEDNFINLGNVKGEVSQRYMISSDSSFFPLVAYDKVGKFIRLPSRLMMSNDALIQAPNLIAAATYEAFMEGYSKGLKGDELDNFIKGHTDGIITYILNNSKGDLLVNGKPSDVANRILSRAREFAKSITFTQDIRTEDAFGWSANKINNIAATNPYMRFLFKFTKAPTNIIKEVNRYVPLVNTPVIKTYPDGTTENLNLVNRLLLNEMKNDLLSTDPIVRKNALGQIRTSMAFGTIIAGMAIGDALTPDSSIDQDPPKVILSGGGPNWRTKEGAAMFITMLKDGWLPYSRGVLQYTEDGDIEYKNGQPVYRWSSYEGLPEPIVGFIRLMVDFSKSSPFVSEKEFGEFTCNWNCAVGRNMFNRSFTSQIDEAMKILSSIPEVGKSDDPEDDVNYKGKKFTEFVGNQIAGSTVPYSSFFNKLHRLPADLLVALGYTQEQALELKNSKGDYSGLKWFMKPDTKTRAGDKANQNRDVNDENFNRNNMWMKILDNIWNKSKEKAPMILGGNLPNQVEHITNEPILYPDKGIVPDLFSLSRHSTSKNIKIHSAYKLIGKILPEPPQIIRGSKFKGLNSDQFEPKKLNKYEYNVLKVIVNTQKLKMGGKELNVKEAINTYLDGQYLPQHYAYHKSQIEQFGLDSEEGKIAQEEIYQQLQKINNKYITNGILMFTKDYIGEKDFNARVEAKSRIKTNYFNNMINSMNNMNLGTF